MTSPRAPSKATPIQGFLNPNACWCPEKGWQSRTHECGADYCKRLWRKIEMIDVEPMPEHHRLVMDLLERAVGEVKTVTGTGLPTTSESPFRDRLLENGSELTWFGLGDTDELLQVRVPIEGVWVDGGEVEEHVDRPARRAPFPNPEPMAYRPKW